MLNFKLLGSNSEEVVCVLLDHTMPGMNGEEVYRALCRESPEVKVILCSGYSEEEATREFQNGDLSGFLQKPYSFTSLITLIRKVLG